MLEYKPKPRQRLPGVPNTVILIVQSQLFIFTIGTFLGTLLAILVVQYYQEDTFRQLHSNYRTDISGDGYDWWLRAKHNSHSVDIDPDILSYGPNSIVESESSFLFHEINIICVIFTKDVKYAKAVNNTWARRCNTKLFFGTFSDENIPVFKMTSTSSWHWLCDVLRFIWKEHNEKLQWVLLATEDTYVIPENFRRYVASFNSSEPYYLGHAMKFWSVEYNLAQSGYALSRRAVQEISEKFNNTQRCASSGKYWKNEDWYLGKYLSESGVHPRDTRDSEGRARFNGYTFSQLLFEGSVSKFGRYYRDSIYKSEQGPNCCSPYAITFHGIEQNKMYLLNYFLYNIKIFSNPGKLGNIPYHDNITYDNTDFNVTTPKSWPVAFNEILDF